MIPRSAAIALTALLTTAACSEAPESSAKKELRVEAAAEDVTIPENAAPREAIPLCAKRYARGFVAEGAIIEGTLTQGGRSDHLIVLKAGHCYRIVGAAEATAKDFDLFLYDPSGVQTHQDPGQDRYPVLGLQAEICPVTGGGYRVQAHMYEGSGAFALALYRTP